MKTIAFIILFVGLAGCATTPGNIKADYFPVEHITKNDIFAFTKKAEYESKEEEQTKNSVIIACSKAFSSNGYRVLAKVIKPDDETQVVSNGGILVNTYPELQEVSPGVFKKSLFLKFETVGKKNRIHGVYGVKAEKTDSKAYSVDDLFELCTYAVKEIPEHQPEDY